MIESILSLKEAAARLLHCCTNLEHIIQHINLTRERGKKEEEVACMHQQHGPKRDSKETGTHSKASSTESLMVALKSYTPLSEAD